MISKKSGLMTGKLLKRICVISFCALLISLPGCRDTDLIKSSYQATDGLIEQTLPPLIPNQTILIASFVNIDDLEESSTFGRTIAEYVGARFTQQGFKVVEMKLRRSVFMKKSAGEFLLSRELHNLSTRHKTQAIVVGTYSVAKDVVYISARIINLGDNTAMSSYSYKLSIGDNIKQMLGLF
ncbi:MAG: hypothetical protein GY749_09285 [Desulfobacteraceae bacterium]|nr:hypothetical protein [Desulfobacteraceae bacterium]